MSGNLYIKIHENDNVGVVISDLKKGDLIENDGLEIQVNSNITFGHKIALKSISKGTMILKYGVAIGISSKDIGAGEHIHVHNMESNYMKQFSK